jgi:hypothetical protein
MELFYLRDICQFWEIFFNFCENADLNKSY